MPQTAQTLDDLYDTLRIRPLSQSAEPRAGEFNSLSHPWGPDTSPPTPVFESDHSPNRTGRDALSAELAARMATHLIEAAQQERLIVASGGNLRDLFSLVREAADLAAERSGVQVIQEPDATQAIRNLRGRYRRALGQSLYAEDQITYPEKAARLKSIYANEPHPTVLDGVLNNLLGAGAVQRLPGEGQYGVHPLVVDILIEQGELPAGSPGGTAL